MADWGSGYVTDSAYVHDFCRVQTPPILALAALAGGIDAPGGAAEPISYCDLGCGQGYTANIVAAANPAARVFAFDFNPSHIANARKLAAAGGLANVEFREASFEQLIEDRSLPELDIICMHGVYGWVSPENRRILVSLINKKLRPGGLLYVSYDCMPGWAGIAPLRRIFVQSFAPRPGASPTAALAQAFAYFDALRKLDARYHKMFPFVEAQIERLRKTPPAYLAHELFPKHWEAFSFGEIASQLLDAKLSHVGSAHMTDWVDRVNFTEEQQQFLSTIADPILAEMTRDMLLGRQFRRDVFVKGPTPLGNLAVRERWLETRFALSTPAKLVEMTFDTALGKLQLRPDIYAPVMEVLAGGAITLRDLIERLPMPRPGWASLTDAVKVMVGRGDLHPCLPANGDAKRAASTQAFNSAILARAAQTSEFGYLASPVTGGGVRVDRAAQLYLMAVRLGLGDPQAYMAKLAEGSVGSPADGRALSPEEARAAAAKETLRVENEILPLLAQLGIC
jgi:SAM-dependent methyltransferase